MGMNVVGIPDCGSIPFTIVQLSAGRISEPTYAVEGPSPSSEGGSNEFTESTHASPWPGTNRNNSLTLNMAHLQGVRPHSRSPDDMLQNIGVRRSNLGDPATSEIASATQA